ncbi:MAG: HlyC/CorC family transporter [Planctomycetes bacterium]|nr:HlyC/CorC family transporter [Planctomycetota bacterium]
MELTLNLVAVVLLLITNALFVAAEFALVKVKHVRVESLANDGSASARMTLRILANLEAYLAACQLGITMASLGLGWAGEPAVAAILEPVFHWAGVPDSVLHPAAFATGFIIFSSLHIVLGEQVPKTLAIRKPETLALATAYLLRISFLVVWPLNWTLNKASSTILRLLGVKEATHGEVYSTEELKGMVDTSREHGEIAHDRATMLKNLFEFDQRQVGRVMIPRGNVAALDLDATPAENLKVLMSSPHSRFPVVSSRSEDPVVGLVLVKDVYTAVLAGDKEPWAELKRFCRKPLIVPDTQRIPTLFDEMRARRAHLACVVDEYGGFLGIVTLEDLIEEIVGEIQDETDEERPNLGVVEVSPGLWEVDALASLSDVEREVGLVVPAELEANTLSGLFLTRIERMPRPGDEITEGGFCLRVLEMAHSHVSKVSIQRLDAPDTPEGATPEQAPASEPEPKEVAE